MKDFIRRELEDSIARYERLIEMNEQKIAVHEWKLKTKREISESYVNIQIANLKYYNVTLANLIKNIRGEIK